MKKVKEKQTKEYISKIAETGSISMAAEELGITQPALSAYLKKKEVEVDAVLFDRTRQPLELTDAGRAYMEYLRKLRKLDHELSQMISDIKEMKTGNLTIGGASFFNVSYIPKAVAEFSELYPGIQIEIVDGNVPELETEAYRGNLDLFISPTSEEDERFQYEAFLSEKIFLAVPRNWEINKKFHNELLTKDQFTELCEYPFLILKRNQNIGQKMEEIFQKFQSRPSHTIIAEQTMTTLALTQAGVGVSLITESSINNINLKEIPRLYIVDKKICKRTMYIAYPRNKYLSYASREFIRILKKLNGE